MHVRITSFTVLPFSFHSSFNPAQNNFPSFPYLSLARNKWHAACPFIKKGAAEQNDKKLRDRIENLVNDISWKSYSMSLWIRLGASLWADALTVAAAAAHIFALSR